MPILFLFHILLSLVLLALHDPPDLTKTVCAPPSTVPAAAAAAATAAAAVSAAAAGPSAADALAPAPFPDPAPELAFASCPYHASASTPAPALALLAPVLRPFWLESPPHNIECQTSHHPPTKTYFGLSKIQSLSVGDVTFVPN